MYGKASNCSQVLQRDGEVTNRGRNCVGKWMPKLANIMKDILIVVVHKQRSKDDIIDLDAILSLLVVRKNIFYPLSILGHTRNFTTVKKGTLQAWRRLS